MRAAVFFRRSKEKGCAAASFMPGMPSSASAPRSIKPTAAAATAALSSVLRFAIVIGAHSGGRRLAMALDHHAFGSIEIPKHERDRFRRIKAGFLRISGIHFSHPALFTNGLIAQSNAHEIIQEHDATQREDGFEATADHRIELQQAAERPARRPRGADHFGADQNRHCDQGGQMKPVDFLRLGHGGLGTLQSADTANLPASPACAQDLLRQHAATGPSRYSMARAGASAT